jgi:transposase
MGAAIGSCRPLLILSPKTSRRCSGCCRSATRSLRRNTQALIAHLRLTIEKLKRDLFGPRNERKARLIDQMELQLEELEAAATEDGIAAELAAAGSGETTQVRAFTRRKPARQPFPAHLPRERIIVPGPTARACCGSPRLAKLGEDVTETLEVVPRQWKVVQTIREKFSAGTARASARRRRRSTYCRAVLPDRACSP